MRKVFPYAKAPPASLTHLNSSSPMRKRPTRSKVEFRSMNDRLKTFASSELQHKTTGNFDKLMSPDLILSKNTIAIDEIEEVEEDSHEQSKVSQYESIDSNSKYS